MSLTVEALAQEIDRLDEISNGPYAGPTELARGLLLFIERHIAERELAAAAYAVDEMQRVGHIAAGVQGAVNPAAEAIQYHNAVGPIDAIYAAFSAMDNNDTPLEEWPQRAIDALAFAGWAVVPYDLPFAILGEAGMTGVFETGNPKHGWDWLVAKTRIGPYGPPAATPQSPKDAGAVPFPEFPHESDGTYWSTPEIDVIRAYGDAREAAGRADAVLYEVANNLMLLVEGPGSLRWEDGEGFRLKDTSEWARFYVEVKNAKERTIPQHPPAEPAARAQVGDGACGYVNKDGTVTWYAENFGTVSCKPKPGAQIFTHPSPAHAADVASLRALIADDGWAISFQSLAQYRTALLERCGSMLSRREAIERAGDDTTKLARLIGVTYPSGCIAFTPEQLTEFARRLAGGDHA